MAKENRDEEAPSGDFDRRLERLEAIVDELEGGELGLEPAIERYREGIRLLQECHGLLGRFRRQVEELGREAEESLTPFADDPDAPGGERGER